MKQKSFHAATKHESSNCEFIRILKDSSLVNLPERNLVYSFMNLNFPLNASNEIKNNHNFDRASCVPFVSSPSSCESFRTSENRR